MVISRNSNDIARVPIKTATQKTLQSTVCMVVKYHFDRGVIFLLCMVSRSNLLSLDIVKKMRKLWLCSKSKKVFLGSINESSDCSYRYLQDITDFLIALVLHKREDDNGLIFFWQSLNNSLYSLPGFVCCNIL